MTTPAPLSRHDRRIATVVGGQIMKRRKEYGWSRAVLAAEIGVSQRAVQSWETADRLPSVPRLYSLAAVLNTKVAYFLP